MSKRPLRRLNHKPALRTEDLDAAIEQLRADLGDAATQLANATRGEDDDEDEDDPLFAVPDLSESAEQALRELLEEETLALVEADGPRGIADHELHHEVLKKALVALKREALSEVAISRKLNPANNLDDLARQVAQSYGWDEPAIARLVADYTEEPRETEGGPTTSLFFLSGPVDLKYTMERLNYVDGRYYRTDIAKWFTFEGYERRGQMLIITGMLQAYRAGVDPVAQDKLATDREISRAT